MSVKPSASFLTETPSPEAPFNGRAVPMSPAITLPVPGHRGVSAGHKGDGKKGEKGERDGHGGGKKGDGKGPPAPKS